MPNPFKPKAPRDNIDTVTITARTLTWTSTKELRGKEITDDNILDAVEECLWNAHTAEAEQKRWLEEYHKQPNPVHPSLSYDKSTTDPGPGNAA